MEELNLMNFNSPTVHTKLLNPNVTDVPPDLSPGNNPFDSVLKHAAENLHNNTPIKTDFQSCPTFTDDFFKMPTDIENFGRESLASLCENDFAGRESLGILKLDLLNTSFNNDILNVPKSPFSILEEQKSNGLLNTAFLHPFSYCQRKRSILSSNSSVGTNPSSLFNSGSLEASEPSKIYSLYNTKHYCDFTSSEDDLNNAFLQSSINKLKLKNCTSCLEIVNNNCDENRKRIFSLPELNTARKKAIQEEFKSEELKAFELDEKLCQNDYEINFIPLKKPEEDEYYVKDEKFNDSVFIEANYIASKIADGSILMGQSFEENLLDCTSPPCFDDLEENDSAGDVKMDAKTVFKVIDKMLPVQQNCIEKDKNKDADNNNLNHGCFNVDNNNQFLWQGSNSSSSSSSTENKNISNNNKFEKHSIGQSISSSSSNPKSKDANELLQDLSEIINNEYKDKQKVEGQQLLFSLANILCSNSSTILSNKTDNFEDSGHSSIEHDDHHHQNDQDFHNCYEVLDLRVVASRSNENEQVLDLSMKSKVENKKRLSQSFSFSRPKFPPTKLINVLKTHTSLKSSTSSLLESSKDKSVQDPVKLKPKKVEEKTSGAKKGPLKAIIPLGNMSRRKSLTKMQSVNTPPKVEQAQSSLFKVKRTSTPTAEPKLKPLAQSTPDSSKPNLDRSKPISCSSQLKKRKFYCPVSPLARPNSIGDGSTNVDLNKSNHSGSAPNLSGNSKKNSSIPSPKAIYRRHSATELKISENKSLPFKRSYSIGKDLKAPGMFSKLKESVVGSALSNSSSSRRSSISSSKVIPVNKRNSTLQEKNSGITSKIKSFSLLGQRKKNGKENIEN